MLDYLNLPGLATIRVQSIGESELLVDVEGGLSPECCATPNCTGGRLLGHGSKEVIFHDIPRDGQWIRVRLKRRRVRCSICGKTASYMVNAFDADRNMTFRLRMDIEKHCLQETYVSIARRVGLDESTVRAITRAHIERLDRKYQQSVLAPAVLGIDEFVIYRMPSAILTNIEARTIYEVLPTRKNVNLEPALRTVVEAGNLRVVVTDMCEAYIRLSQRLAPAVPVVVDRFHVVRMANDVLDSVRKRVQRTLPDGERQAESGGAKLVHGSGGIVPLRAE